MRRLFAVLVPLLSLMLAACGSPAPRTSALVSVSGVSALVPLPDGGVRYGERISGAIYDTDRTGTPRATPVAKVDVYSTAENPHNGLLGLAIDDDARTFASWMDATTGTMTVGQVVPGPTRVIWQSDEKPAMYPGGRMTFTPEGRLNVITNGDTPGDGRILSLDPDRGGEQQPNTVSTGWHALGGLAYAAGASLWVIDNGSVQNEEDRLLRPFSLDTNGSSVTDLGKNRHPSSLMRYGDNELVACLSASGKLQRFFLDDGIAAVPGRTIADDCTSDVIELKDGRVAYATKNEIRVTAL